ncbi:tetratricopeptide repeat-containing sulfotransferase family protein [Arenimonas sp.]|uniref:tetratricopeptide repeat-containing sulfotransferase family protein n=1 Tax=Arenimonas sp. TaxID=1872635 RepID=UPI0025BA1B34|nr:tetratricopeptide repeat-containing sulfotransferase family protein [Arenimonas sp.]
MPPDSNRVEHALSLAEAGRQDEAETLLAHLAGHDRDPMAAWHLAWLRIGQGDTDGALAALADFPDDALCSERARELLVGQRRNDEALALLTQVPRQPPSPAGWVATAIEHHVRGDYPAAVAACRQALALAPAHAPGHNHLARALHNLGDTPAAIAEFERAVAIDPHYPEAWHNLGHALRATNQFERAREALRRALNIAPGYLSARHGLGVTLLAMDRPAEALEAFDDVLRRDRDHAEALLHSALSLQALGMPAKARQRFERAVEVAPENPWSHYCLGLLLHELRELPAARAALQRSLKLHSNSPDAWAALAAVAEEAGDPALAALAVNTGLTLAPHHAVLNLEAARIERRAGKPADALRRLTGVEPRRLVPRVRQRFHYERGKALDAAGTDAGAEAFIAFAEANALALQEVRGPRRAPEALAREFAAVTRWAAAGAAGTEAGDDGGDLGADLCFLVGFPRTGQFLVERLLRGHPALALASEAGTLEGVVGTVAGLPGGYPEAIAALDKADRQVLRRKYRLALERAGAKPGLTIVDIASLRATHAGLVQALFPRARLLRTLRDPRDVVLRNFMEPQATPAAFPAFQTLAGTVALYEAHEAAWQALEPQLQLPRHDIRHEQIVAAPSETLAAICGFLGLAADADWLAAARSRLEAGRRPATTTSGAHWQRYREPLAAVLPALAAHALRLGYPD